MANQTITKPTTQPQESPESLAERMEKMESDQGVLGQLIADPQIAMILRARQEGKEIEITEKKQESSPEEQEAAAKEKKLESVEDQNIQLMRDVINQKLAPLVEKVDYLSAMAGEMQKTAVKDQVQEIANKYTDFDSYRDKMREMAKINPGLGVEQLYILAKHQSGALKIASPSTHSERPTPTPRRFAAEDAPTEPRLGKKGFRDMMADALDSALNPDKE